MLHIFGQFAPARKICLNIRKQMKKDYSAAISCGMYISFLFSNETATEALAD